LRGPILIGQLGRDADGDLAILHSADQLY
jgi:hypothetical protein